VKAARLAMLVCLLAMGSQRVHAQESTRAYRIKAAYLFNFVRFTSWPDASTTARTICVIGEAGFAPSLQGLDGNVANGSEVQTYSGPGLPEDRRCDVVFIGRDAEANTRSILRAVASRPVLTVSMAEGFARNGGMIGMRVAENRIRLDVHIGALRSAGLRVTS